MSKHFLPTIGFWVAWACATFAGWFIGGVIAFWLLIHFKPPYTEFILLFLLYILISYAIGLVWAVLAGAGQMVMMGVRRASGWLLWGLPTFFGIMVIWIFKGENFWGGALGGLVAGVGQWLMLRQNIASAGWWIPHSVPTGGLSPGVGGVGRRRGESGPNPDRDVGDQVREGVNAVRDHGLTAAEPSGRDLHHAEPQAHQRADQRHLLALPAAGGHLVGGGGWTVHGGTPDQAAAVPPWRPFRSRRIASGFGTPAAARRGRTRGLRSPVEARRKQVGFTGTAS